MANYADYLRAHFSKLGVLIIELGRYCPVQCDHCHVESDMTTKERLSLTVVLDAIRAFAELPSSQFVSFTGGEPFVYWKILSEALSAVESSDLSSFVLTSGSWADTETKSVDILKKIGVPDLLGISIDRYHLQKLSIDNPCNAAFAATQLGVPAFIALGSFGPHDPIREYVRDILNARGCENISIIHYPLLSRGKGAGLPELDGLSLDNPSDQACLSIGAQVLTTSGAITACCHTTVANNARSRTNDPLVMSKTGSIKESVETFYQSRLVRLLRNSGPIGAANELGIDLPDDIMSSDICVCCDFLRGRIIRDSVFV